MSIPMFPTFTDQDWDAMMVPSATYCQLEDGAVQNEAVEACVVPGSSLSRLSELLGANGEDDYGVLDLSRLSELLGANGEDDYGVLDPTQHAFKNALDLVIGSDRFLTFSLPGSPSVDSRGGIRITWKLSGREIRLVCPAT